MKNKNEPPTMAISNPPEADRLLVLAYFGNSEGIFNSVCTCKVTPLNHATTHSRDRWWQVWLTINNDRN